MKHILTTQILPNLSITESKLKSIFPDKPKKLLSLITKILLKMHFTAENGIEALRDFVGDDFFNIDAIIKYITFSKPAQNYISCRRGDLAVYSALIRFFVLWEKRKFLKKISEKS